MVKIVHQNPDTCYGELELAHMIDTGGQPETLEVYTSFLDSQRRSCTSRGKPIILS